MRNCDLCFFFFFSLDLQLVSQLLHNLNNEGYNNNLKVTQSSNTTIVRSSPYIFTWIYSSNYQVLDGEEILC